MAAINAQVQFRLFPPTRWLLLAAAQSARIGLVMPHSLIVAVTNRSWRMRIGDGCWRAIQINSSGRIV